ncbi:ABC transporter permease [Carboxylicivirga sp. A043]|uniref:ABC transporter permease n=1 Tax=Carboxylicivirga litoralis TaxID=2816963 RepID=UPI0021CAE798|nr:ABC transporter permease [Carboxylicivirga sp. A043]MCU4156529.1 ABC transporter permease [Carboxylicivirga sp. A043]
MIKFKLILRRLMKSKGILAINLLGLSVAFCTIMYLASYVVQEFSYDTHIKNHERIYRLLSIMQEGESTEIMPINRSEKFMRLKEQVPEVEEVVNVFRMGQNLFQLGEEQYFVRNTFMANVNFFKVFEFETIYGDLNLALEKPENLVITQSLSEKIFGKENPVGKQIHFDKNLHVISAVIADIPDNTHFACDVVQPMSKGNGDMSSIEYLTYVRFKKGVDYHQAAIKCEEVATQVLTDFLSGMDVVCGSKMEPLADIHLKTIASWDQKENGSLILISFLAILSIAILIIALSNYINLLMAKKETYIKMVSIQKVFGTTRKGLIVQFAIESLLVITMAMIIAVVLFYVVKVDVSEFLNIKYLDTVWYSWPIYAILIGVYLSSVLIACIFPAWQISQINVRDLIHSHNIKTQSKSALLVFQFALVSFLVFGILTVQKQISFIENKPKGFVAENVINCKGNSDESIARWADIKKEILKLPNVVDATASHAYPGGNEGSGQGLSYKQAPAVGVNEVRVKPGYLNVFGIQLKEGRFFTGEAAQNEEILVNETALRKLGIEDAIGTLVDFSGQTVEIIGVVKDYHYSSLKDRIQPTMMTNWSNYVWNFSVKLDGFNNAETINNIYNILKRFDPDYTGNIQYLDDELNRLYYQEHALRRIFYLGTTLGLLIALIGLLAYAAVLSSRRTKEIGIRKVNGANNLSIIQLLSKNYLKHILIAYLIASPIAYYAMREWLNGFAYKTTIGLEIFGLAGTFTIVISIATISWQSWRTATQNPVKALRYE